MQHAWREVKKRSGQQWQWWCRYFFGSLGFVEKVVHQNNGKGRKETTLEGDENEWSWSRGE
jgi:hypothetical protein